MNQFYRALNVAYTLNGALSNASTRNPCLDFFAQGGSLRYQSEDYIYNLVEPAWRDNPQLTLQIMAWIYDCRGGCGERDVFYALYLWLTVYHTPVARRNLSLIPKFGRWDMLIRLLALKELEGDILALIAGQLREDKENKEKGQPVSLCAKWLPREGKQDEDKAKLLRDYMKLSAKEYRKLLADLSRYIQVVEQKMSAREWERIDYERVPSRASMIYRDCFRRHDEVRYTQYLSDVETGKASIKAGQLYPYDIVRIYLTGGKDNRTLELQWKALPNPFKDGTLKAIVPVVDVSGSMYGYGTKRVRPLDISVSLGLFFAEKNPSVWGGSFITFSERPEFVSLKGKTLHEKITNIMSASWGYNTNIQAVFNLILDRCTRAKLKQEDLPEMILIISDMEFDAATVSGKTNFEAIDREFQKAGYKRPILVFWNVDGKSGQFPVTKEDERVILLSGFSPNVFNALMEGKIADPVAAMLATVNTEKYREWRLY